VTREIAFELDAVGAELVRHRRQEHADRHGRTLFERQRPVTLPIQPERCGHP
jgi:hypothetical protein